MDKIKLLKSKKVLRELDFIESDYEYRQEIVTTADKEFIESVNLFLQQHIELKEIYENKINEQLDLIINSKIPKEQNNIEEKSQNIEFQIESEFEDWNNSEIIDDKQSRLKKIYREIAKITHPDVVKNLKLNELYLKSTGYYDSGNILGLFSVCGELDINYEIKPTDIEEITNQISNYKQKISFLENTYTWRWFHTEDEDEKIKLIFDFVQQRIR
jgi:hypothetical protein